VVSNAGPLNTLALAGEAAFPASYVREVRETVRPAPLVWIQSAVNRPDFKHPGWMHLVNSRRVNITLCPSLVAPDLAPPGKHLLCSGSSPPSSLPPFDFKKEIELHILDLAENFPEFASHGEVLSVGCFWGQWPGYGTWPGYEVPQRTPVRNLFNVGDAVGPGGLAGNPAAAASARAVVRDIREHFPPAG